MAWTSDRLHEIRTFCGLIISLNMLPKQWRLDLLLSISDIVKDFQAAQHTHGRPGGRIEYSKLSQSCDKSWLCFRTTETTADRLKLVNLRIVFEWFLHVNNS